MNWQERIEKKSHREKKVFFQALALGLILLIIDQITKWYIVKNFNLFESIPVITGWFNITSVRNLGAAWSILSGHVWLLLVFGLLGAIVGQIGDLSLSVIKREVGIKDYGKLFPGHGGVWDRFDSILFAAPLFELIYLHILPRL